MKVIFSCSFSVDDSYPSNEKYVMDHYIDEVVAAIEKEKGCTIIKDDDEGGIRSWFGGGSVMCYELGLALRTTEGPYDNVTVEILA